MTSSPCRASADPAEASPLRPAPGSGAGWSRFRRESRLLRPVVVDVFGRGGAAGGCFLTCVLLADNAEQGRKDGAVRTAALPQGSADGAQDMRAVAEHVAGFRQAPAAQILEHHRQVVRKLVGAQAQPRALVNRLELDHGLAAVPRLAMNMLEEMERGGAAPVEEFDIALLGPERIGRSQQIDQ